MLFTLAVFKFSLNVTVIAMFVETSVPLLAGNVDITVGAVESGVEPLPSPPPQVTNMNIQTGMMASRRRSALYCPAFLGYLCLMGRAVAFFIASPGWRFTA